MTASKAGSSQAAIVDPSLSNMTAIEVTIPAGWHFQGALMQGGQCVSTPYPVYRVSSPDGLSAMEREPMIGWTFGTGPLEAAEPKDCLPLKTALPAQEFLKYLAPTMGLTYVSDVTEPAAENAAAQQQMAQQQAIYAPKYAAAHLTPPKSTLQLARARVSFKNGTFAMLGELRVSVSCTEGITPARGTILPGSDVTQCTATTQFLSAPTAQLTSVLATWDAPGLGPVSQQPWQQAWMQRSAQQAQQTVATVQKQTAAAMAASHAMFEQTMATQAQMHQQFMAQMQAGTDAAMANANAVMNAQSTAASDWVNYALGQQTVLDPATGQVSNVSAASTYTWMNSAGNTSYQTNDPNANPNGVMQGTWTKQVVVHGNGTPQ
jgi:hypothetical protein